MKNFSDVNEILDFAIAREQDAADFYHELAKTARNIDMKEVFTGFSKEEMGHKKRLMSIKESGQIHISEEDILDMKMADYLVETNAGPDISYQDALILAMKREKAAFRLYMDMHNRISDSLLKNIFLSLAQEESKHKLRFEIEYDEVINKEN